ncbi:acid-sensing ion channel 1 [Lingula anatina]|uniref:Acid-sensing ion channel 1 n=1 Tax=Lingula anatina TaxID=7574 RepID=A0A1S3IIH8_LINAN|nr:acid-sensing ion channel 1 [Lingula anatina]|eukprot:XP_013397928.1 acid-sensing ion channel 1 [Lingula anatina]
MLNAPGSCEWNAQPCSVDNFTRILTEMGVCYTFNHGDTNLKTELLGSTFGLKLILNAEQYNYLATTHSAGFTVLLHHPDDVPYIENLGFQVAPGESISVGISQTKVTNLPSPYGNCAEKNLAYYDSYSTLNCIAECTLNFTMDNCGCRAYYMINVPGVPECSPTQWWECLDELRANTSAALQACACPVPCEEVHYGYTISHSKMSNAITAALMAGYPGTTEDYFRDNYLILQIFYKELNFQGIEQQPAYSGLALFSDIGGALGLVLGSTLMTAAEIIDFAVSLCLWVAFRRK